MITKDQIEQFYTDLEKAQFKFPGAALVAITNEAKGNVSKIINRKMEPSESFIKRFYEGYKKVPRGANAPDLSEPTPPKPMDALDLYRLLIENAASLKAALAVHAELVSSHGVLARANSDLAVSNRVLAEAARSHIVQSTAVRPDGGTIKEPDAQKQKADLRRMLKDDLSKQKSRRGGTPGR